MKKFVFAALAVAASATLMSAAARAESIPPASATASPVASEAAAPVVVSKGKMLVAAGGARLAPVYRIAADGSPQIIVEGRIVTVPAATLSIVDGKLTTSLTKNQVTAQR